MFHPVIGNKSKEILQRKENSQEERLKKTVTAHSGRTDYFEAKPKGNLQRISHIETPESMKSEKPFKVDPM